MSSLTQFNIDLDELFPTPGPVALNSCSNPDCRAFGVPYKPIQKRLPPKGRRTKRCSTAEALEKWQMHRPGAYALTGTNKKNQRTSTAFGYASGPLSWRDQRTVKCQSMLRDGTICGTRFSLLSDDHFAIEVGRLRNMNGVLDGPACGACGRRYLDAPDEFSMNGAHQRADKTRRSAPKAIRVIHKTCKGKRGARFSISIPHARQKETKDNIRILHALVNSAGINDVHRLLAADATGRKAGISRIYDRLFWIEQVFLAFEREMLARWRRRIESMGRPVVHRLSHDDLVLSVNWEAATARSITLLNCSVTADVDSGYVYRIDVDFDPQVSPMEFFRDSYLDENDLPNRISWSPKRAKGAEIPMFPWQRPTGRFQEAQFFAACENELWSFMGKASKTILDKDLLSDIQARVDVDINLVRTIGRDWFGLDVDPEKFGGSFRGMATRKTYTKAAHFQLLKEMLPKGKLILTTEQEAMLSAILPHVFREEIKENRFNWLMMSFNKSATKPEILRKVKTYRDEWKRFFDDGLYSGRFNLMTEPEDVTKAFIADRMRTALRLEGGTAKPFHGSNYERAAFPQLWVRAPTQASGELDKIVGFPIVDVWLRHRLKELEFDHDAQSLDDEMKDELSDLVYHATLQPASAFMNAVRERLAPTVRAGGGARASGSYIQGAAFNPRTLIALLNVFRVHYNFFELRPYVALHNEDRETSVAASGRRALRFPGTDELIPIPPMKKRRPLKKTPAMRHGIEIHARMKNGVANVPNIYRTLYRPWLYAGTPVGRRFERSGSV